MSFDEALARCAAEIDELLDRLIPEKGTAAPRLAAAMRHAAVGQGKRLRPFFVVESAALFGVGRTLALRAGAALECVHCYSLVHDDLPAMDDDDLRRGRPTVHRAFDEATAILAGDSLLTFAFEILASPETHPDAAVRNTLVLELARAAGASGMAGGQMLDLEAETGGERSIAAIERLQALKTGALFHFACEAGAIMGGGDLSPLRRYAAAVGLAFQIADDILDVTSTPETLGKGTQKDRELGKATFVDLLGLDGAQQKARRLADEAIAALEGFGPGAETLRGAARFIVERRK